MDNVTHALAGCVLAAATVTIVERRGVTTSGSFRTAATLVGIVAAELPDSDLVYAGQALGMGKLGYLLHHRGHTHTILFALAGALLVWLAVLAFRKEVRAAPYRNVLLALALCGTFSHLALDYTNNYGVHPFWPFLNRWFYGDSVFIVEPWLWVVAIPPLYLFYRGRIPKFVLASLLLIILVAAWLLGMVGREVAVVLTAGAVIWTRGVRSVPEQWRIMAGAAGWIAVELVFGVASAQGRAAIEASVDPATFRDVSLTPFVGNPFCYNALVVEVDGAAYRVTNATVAPFSGVRTSQACAAAVREAAPSTPRSDHVSTERVQWANTWSAPVEELRRIVATRCEAAAAMQFIRVPQWSERTDGAVEFGDARFGEGGRGFASVIASLQPASCPRLLPGWTPPRGDILR